MSTPPRSSTFWPWLVLTSLMVGAVLLWVRWPQAGAPAVAVPQASTGPSATSPVAPTSPVQIPAVGEPSLADVLEAAGDLAVPENRARVVAQMRDIEQRRRHAAVKEAERLGLPVRVTGPGGRVQELAGFENGKPVYFTTHNVAAAISTGADVLRASPYSLLGSGITVGVWDGGSVRSTHQEFAVGSRAVVKDASASVDHATHVGGTTGPRLHLWAATPLRLLSSRAVSCASARRPRHR
jgi:hypothetical protein